MQDAHDLFFSFVSSERLRLSRRVRFAGLMCVLILVLLYWTEWLFLRPGLAILLAGQAGALFALLFRNNQHSKTLVRRGTGGFEAQAFAAWFEGEELFVRRFGLFESACQTCGFVALGYGFWVATGSVWLALAIGVVYPATMYFGITRGKTLKTARDLVTQEQKIATSLVLCKKPI